MLADAKPIQHAGEQQPEEDERQHYKHDINPSEPQSFLEDQQRQKRLRQLIEAEGLSVCFKSEPSLDEALGKIFDHRQTREGRCGAQVKSQQ